jgi:hypothetical protein
MAGWGSDSADLLLNNLLKKITRDIVYDPEKNHPVVLSCQQKGINIHFSKYKIDELLFQNGHVYHQMLDYIYNSPVRKGLFEKAEDYKYSFAGNYQPSRGDFDDMAA